MILVNLISPEREKTDELKPSRTFTVLFGKPLLAHSIVRMMIAVGAGFLVLSFMPPKPRASHAKGVEPHAHLASPARIPNSITVPDLPRYRDNDDVLDKYPQYLDFVMRVGQRTKPKLAKGLKAKYEALRRRDPRGAADFLRGLRIEIVHKLHLMGLPPYRATTSNRVLRRWVTKYMTEWYHEADEYLFRSIAKRNRD